MQTMELFSGTGSFSKVALARGHKIYRIDNNPSFDSEMVHDILDIDHLGKGAGILWASPPCQAFSVASIYRHWGGKREYIPISEKARNSLLLLDHLIFLISDCRPTYWFIENPMGIMRKKINPIFRKYGLNPIRHTITYCQYGDKRMKPTDIWTNCKEWQPRLKCKNGSSCHESAPRGSNKGTQGLSGAKERGVIPPALFEEIFKVIER